MLEVNHLGVSALVEHKETITLQQMLGDKKYLYPTRVRNIIFLEIVRKINKILSNKIEILN